MWTEVPGYRSTSPGEKLVPTFLEVANWRIGDTLVDLGCGPGRAGLELSKAGFNVTLLDITKHAVDPESRGVLPFIESCLWEPTTLRFDWAYCCDVAEHLPPEWVESSLDNIANIARRGAFLQIALWPETWGNKIGETLHLTIKPGRWWLDEIERRWPIAWQETSYDGRLIVLTGEPFMVKKKAVKKSAVSKEPKKIEATKQVFSKCPVDGCTSTPPCMKHKVAG